MSDPAPPSLLVTPDTRRRLQQRYEEAARLVGQRPHDPAIVHELLAECLRADPGNILYLDALLANLRRWQPRPQRTWRNWFGLWRNPRNEFLAGTPFQVASAAPDNLRQHYGQPAVLRHLATAAGDCDLDEAELRYLFEARRLVADDVDTLRQLARALTRQGRFEDAVGPWFAVLALAPDAEATQAVEDLRKAVHAAENPPAQAPADAAAAGEVESSLQAARSLQAEGRMDHANHYLTRAQHAAGGDLQILALREDLRLAHSEQRLEMARLRASSDPHPQAQSLVGRMEQEHNRLTIDILHVRSERHPDDLSLRLELARRLKQAGNYSGAIQRLEEAAVDPALAAEANLELGECWQHLRQFGKALGYYRNVVPTWEGEAPAEPPPRPLVAALYRIGVLAAAMNEPGEARAALTRLLEIEPEYKDARERLDKLP
jgi:tetratricopeptide (TPR) repeat protein